MEKELLKMKINTQYILLMEYKYTLITSSLPSSVLSPLLYRCHSWEVGYQSSQCICNMSKMLLTRPILGKTVKQATC